MFRRVVKNNCEKREMGLDMGEDGWYSEGAGSDVM